MDDVTTIIKFLETNATNCVSPVDKGLKLPNGDTRNKYLWTRAKILEQYPTIEAFLAALPAKGYTNGTKLLLRQIMGGTFKPRGEITLNFKDDKVPVNDMNNSQTNSNLQKPQNAPTTHPELVPTYASTPAPQPPQVAMGFTQVPQHNLIDLMVKEGRYLDLAEKCAKAEESASKARTEVDLLKAKNAALELQLKTSEKLNELTIREKDLDRELNKKPWHESEVVKEGITALAGVLPQLLSNGNAAPALAAPQTNSAVKNEMITALSSEQITDIHVYYLKLVLTGMVRVDQFTPELDKLLIKAGLKNGE